MLLEDFQSRFQWVYPFHDLYICVINKYNIVPIAVPLAAMKRPSKRLSSSDDLDGLVEAMRPWVCLGIY